MRPLSIEVAFGSLGFEQSADNDPSKPTNLKGGACPKEKKSHSFPGTQKHSLQTPPESTTSP